MPVVTRQLDVDYSAVPAPTRRVVASCRLDTDEDARRCPFGFGGLDDLPLLDSLLNLPEGWPIPIEDLGTAMRDALQRAPDGVVGWEKGRVTRLARPPLEVSRVVVFARRMSKAAVKQAGSFGQYAERAIALPKVPDAPDYLVALAASYGIGVGVQQEQGLVWLAKPRQFRPHIFTAARWRFAERVYSRLVAVGVAKPGGHSAESA